MTPDTLISDIVFAIATARKKVHTEPEDILEALSTIDAMEKAFRMVVKGETKKVEDLVLILADLV